MNTDLTKLQENKENSKAAKVEFAMAMNNFMSVIRQSMNISTETLKDNGRKEKDSHLFEE